MDNNRLQPTQLGRGNAFAMLWVLIALTTLASLVMATPDETLVETAAGEHAKSWLTAHNVGSPEAIEAWIRSSYTPEKLESIQMDEQVDFYLSIVTDSPKLWPEPYEVVISTEHRAVVQYLSRDLSFDVEDPDPTQILLVEIDVDPDRPQYLARGLGLGALFCATKE